MPTPTKRPSERRWFKQVRCPCCGMLMSSVSINRTLLSGGHRLEVVRRTGLGYGRGWQIERERLTWDELELLRQCAEKGLRQVEGDMEIRAFAEKLQDAASSEPISSCNVEPVRIREVESLRSPLFLYYPLIGEVRSAELINIREAVNVA